MAKSKQTYVKPAQRTTSSRDMQEKIHDDTKTRTQENSEAIKAELDELMAEVDGILDGNEEFTNAQAFVEGFIQKGGE